VTGHGLTILLVEDESCLRRVLARSLEARGHRVVAVATGREAVATALAEHVDLMLLDVNLPDAAGWDVLRELMLVGQPIPTVILSAVPPSASRVRQLHPVAVLRKPFPIDALLQIVQAVQRGALTTIRDEPAPLPIAAAEEKP